MAIKSLARQDKESKVDKRAYLMDQVFDAIFLLFDNNPTWLSDKSTKDAYVGLVEQVIIHGDESFKFMVNKGKWILENLFINTTEHLSQHGTHLYIQ